MPAVAGAEGVGAEAEEEEPDEEALQKLMLQARIGADVLSCDGSVAAAASLYLTAYHRPCDGIAMHALLDGLTVGVARAWNYFLPEQ
jgi:hypothetical protein